MASNVQCRQKSVIIAKVFQSMQKNRFSAFLNVMDESHHVHSSGDFTIAPVYPPNTIQYEQCTNKIKIETRILFLAFTRMDFIPIPHIYKRLKLISRRSLLHRQLFSCKFFLFVFLSTPLINDYRYILSVFSER